MKHFIIQFYSLRYLLFRLWHSGTATSRFYECILGLFVYVGISLSRGNNTGKQQKAYYTDNFAAMSEKFKIRLPISKALIKRI